MPAKTWKEWEGPVLELQDGIAKLRQMAAKEADSAKRKALESKIAEYEARLAKYIDTQYSQLGPWEKVLVARAEPRPYTLDFIQAICSEFIELEGDRRYGNDPAIVGGPAVFRGRPIVILGHQKGRNIQQRQYRNFGMAKPEGYRKAIRLMQMADRFGLPVVALLDTPAADPGVDSESRGISEAIADSILTMLGLRVPTVAAVIGEGGSGGAIGIGVGNHVLMLEHAVYSVIPPEGCAAILWRQPERGDEAAAALRLTAQSAMELGLIDRIVPEPKGGAHRAPDVAALSLGDELERSLKELSGLTPEELREQRYRKYRSMGVFGTAG
ncbi:MAG: acetyl-CoA carboxylase carboxyltransferase subunit alpha [Fimbriimonadales bacterium]|nr:acetyl-CoA carboxylase carboxyltransferase subunit alpha [Fimbriimonadales bacterium]